MVIPMKKGSAEKIRHYKNILKDVPGETNVSKFITAIRGKLGFEFSKAGFENVFCRLAFKDFVAYNGNVLTAVKLFVECPGDVDKDIFSSIVSRDDIRYNGITALFEVVENIDRVFEHYTLGDISLPDVSEDIPDTDHEVETQPENTQIMSNLHDTVCFDH